MKNQSEINDATAQQLDDESLSEARGGDLFGSGTLFGGGRSKWVEALKEMLRKAAAAAAAAAAPPPAR